MAAMGPSRLELSKPVIAAVAGPAVAGGMELALWADIRVMEETAYMGVYCRRWGIPLIDGGTVRLPRLVGEGRAKDLILTGRRVDADEALRIGLCEYVVPEGEARAKAEALAHDIRRFPQSCMRADRRSERAARSDRTRRPSPGMAEQQGGSGPGHRGRGPLRSRQGTGRRFRERLNCDLQCIAARLSRADRDDAPGRYLSPMRTPREAAHARVEGWILGVLD